MKIPLHAMEIFLQPGDLWFGDDETRVRTILGSCVALTLWHPERRIGGMCHYMLPARPAADRAADKAADLDGRYGDEALEMLLQELSAAGTRPGEYVAKLFGGGRMFVTNDPTRSVPDKNVAAARALAAHHGFKVAAEHLGGHGHRHVVLDIWDGKTWLKYSPSIAPMPGETLAGCFARPELASALAA